MVSTAGKGGKCISLETEVRYTCLSIYTSLREPSRIALRKERGLVVREFIMRVCVLSGGILDRVEED